MPQVKRDLFIARTPEDIFAFHDDPSNLAKILPAYLRVEILKAPPRLRVGGELQYTMYLGPLRFDWKLEIAEHEPPSRFVDVQRSGPFLEYRHTHLFAPEAQGTRMTSIIDYELPGGALGQLAQRVVLQDRLSEVLEQVHQATRTLLESQGS